MNAISIQEIKLNIQAIEYVEYELKPIYFLNAKARYSSSKRGFLLKIEFKNLGLGYADCFSWEELGDVCLNQQIQNLRQGIYNNHLEKSIYFAYVDAYHRSKNINVFNGLILPKNHYTCVNYNELNIDYIENLHYKSFSNIKIKCGIYLDNEIKIINNIAPYLKRLKMNIRLDFNSTLNLSDFHRFLVEIENNLEVINFIEDPFVFGMNEWKNIKNLFPKIKLAVDRIDENILLNNEIISKNSFDYIVLKPAIQNINKILKNNSNLKNNSILFTSYMDHPLGQISALYECAKFYENKLYLINDCGFLTHNLYKKNAYSETLSISNSRLIPSSEGFGFGFDALLEKERWRKLC